jgi:hypothetical protein
MKWRWIAPALLCASAASDGLRGQGADANLMREAAAVRAEIARSASGLRQYAWTEQTEVRVSGTLKSSNTLTCRYDASGELLKTPLATGKKMDGGQATSKRPIVRDKADLRDYIERAVTRVNNYAPPKPEVIDYVLSDGQVSLGRSADGNSEIRLTHYYADGDSLVFTYNSQSKLLLRAAVVSTLGSAKDPVTLEAVFETLPDGLNHVSSAVLNAKKRNVEVKMFNLDYRKVAQYSAFALIRRDSPAARCNNPGSQEE